MYSSCITPYESSLRKSERGNVFQLQAHSNTHQFDLISPPSALCPRFHGSALPASSSAQAPSCRCEELCHHGQVSRGPQRKQSQGSSIDPQQCWHGRLLSSHIQPTFCNSQMRTPWPHRTTDPAARLPLQSCQLPFYVQKQLRMNPFWFFSLIKAAVLLFCQTGWFPPVS